MWERSCIGAQFFIAPTFDKDAVNQEVRAIDSENRNSMTSDAWRNYVAEKVFYDSSDPGDLATKHYKKSEPQKKEPKAVAAAADASGGISVLAASKKKAVDVTKLIPILEAIVALVVETTQPEVVLLTVGGDS